MFFFWKVHCKDLFLLRLIQNLYWILNWFKIFEQQWFKTSNYVFSAAFLFKRLKAGAAHPSTIQFNSSQRLAGYLVLHSAWQTDIHHDCAVVNRSRMDQYNPIRNTVSLGSKAYRDLRNLTTRQYVNIEPSCSCDSGFPSLDTAPATARIPTVFHCNSPYAINFNLRLVVNHSPIADTQRLQERAEIGSTKLLESGASWCLRSVGLGWADFSTGVCKLHSWDKQTKSWHCLAPLWFNPLLTLCCICQKP